MTNVRRGVRLSGWLVIIMFAAVMAAGQTRLGAPSYQDPGSPQWTAWAAPGAKAIGIMIVNLDNGDDESYYPSVDRAIRATRKQGILVIGYTYTGYGARDPKIVRRKIDAVYRNYLVDGIFFDEAPTDCNARNPFLSTQFLYYEALTNYVRQKAGARITVLNPGIYSPSDCWMGITNILMNWEDQGLANYQNYYVDFAWVHKYPSDRFWHIVYGMGADQLQAALALAKQRNAGWVYLTQETGNPYKSPPQYWKAEAEAVEQQGVQAPFASAWPDSFDAQGARMRGRTSIRWGGGERGKLADLSRHRSEFEDRVQRRRHCWRGIHVGNRGWHDPFVALCGHRHRLEVDGSRRACRARRARSRRSGCELRHRGLGRHESFEFSDPCFGRCRSSNL